MLVLAAKRWSENTACCVLFTSFCGDLLLLLMLMMAVLLISWWGLMGEGSS